MLAIGAAILEGVLIGGAVGVVVGGTIVAIKALMDAHEREMQRIINLRNETIQKLKNQDEKEIHRHREFRRVFELFELEVEQARKIVEEAEYKNSDGKTIKGYEGRLHHLSRSKKPSLADFFKKLFSIGR